MIVPTPTNTPLNARPEPAPRLTLNADLARQLFETLYSSYFKEATRSAYIEVRGKRESDKDMTFRAFYPNIEQTVNSMSRWPADRHYWFGVAPRWSDIKGTKKECLALTAIFSDVDYGSAGHKKKNRWQTREEAQAAIDAFPIEPSIVVHTGGGFQVYWILSEPFGLENGNCAQVEAIMKGIGAVIGADDGTQDVSRIFRIPGTFNVKTDVPRPVEIVEFHTVRVYALADFAHYADQTHQEQARKREAPPQDGLQTTNIDELNVPAWVKGLIRSGDTSGYGNDRSKRDHAVIGALRRAGCNLDTIEAIYEANPVGDKYREKGPHGRAYLQTSIKNLGQPQGEASTGGQIHDRVEREAIKEEGLPDYGLTDQGNAYRFKDQYGRDVRWCDQWGKFLCWDERRWSADQVRKVELLAIETVKRMYAEASHIRDKDTRKAIADHAKRSEADGKRKAMLSSVKCLLPILPEELDRDPLLLNVMNGTVDFQTGELRPHSRGDFLTKLAPVHFDRKAKCPLWWNFLSRILPPEIIEFAQKAIGYSATGLTVEQVFFLLYGGGDNGKTTFLEIIGSILGDYTKETDPETFMVKKHSGIPNDLAALRGARFVKSVETSGGRRMSEARIKQMTGGDTLTARFLHAEWFEFRPEFKLWLATNHKPVIRDSTHSMWRRVRFIPFEVQIPKEEQDKRLPDKLKEEYPGILNWIIEGALLWQHEGLEPPESIKKATQNYREEMDDLGDFLSECCIVAHGASGTAKELFEAYTDWAHVAGEKKPLSKRGFGLALGERGFHSERGTGARFWRGIGLRSSDA